MLRRIGAVVAGFAVFEAVVLMALFAARTGWPAYASAEPSRAYDFGMLLVRLAVGASATLAGGTLAAMVDRQGRQGALRFGATLLVLSVIWHIRIWDQYPVWYHLSWFACIVPFAVLGGRIAVRHGKTTEGSR